MHHLYIKVDQASVIEFNLNMINKIQSYTLLLIFLLLFSSTLNYEI